MVKAPTRCPPSRARRHQIPYQIHQDRERALKQRFAACAGLMALALVGTSLVGASEANAQVTIYGLYGPRYYAPGVPPWRVMRIVRSAGFQPISAAVRRGPNYAVTAVDRDGGPVRVVISAYDGDIVGVRPVAALQPYGGAPAPYDPRAGAVASAPSTGAVPPDDEPSPSYAPPPARGGYGSGPGPGPGPGPGAGPGPGGTGGYSGPSAGLDRGPQATPPRAVPNQQQQRLATAPPPTGSVTTAPAQPARTPIPRPRPKVASTDKSAATAAPASPPAAAPQSRPSASTTDVPEAPPAPTRARPATPLVPVAPLD